MSGSASWIASNVNILNNIATSLLPVERLVSGAAYVIGITFAIKALMSLKALGESKSNMSASSSNSIKEPAVYLFVAAIFIYFPTGLAIMLQTTFGTSNILQYAPINSSNPAIDTLFGSGSMVGRSLAIIIQVIGIIAFVRGWVLIARASSGGQQPGGTGKGLIHVFGGILAMNIVLTLQIINNTLYGTS